MSLHRRRGNYRQVAHAGQGHVQSSRNWCRRHRQQVDIGAHRLQFFLVANAEAMFFVDNNETQVAVLDAFGQQFVSADNDIDFTRRQFRQVLLEFRFVGKPGQACYA